ncbi:MAG: enoyl-CoA hydratase/isomerase family protein [Myxococcales bacterium]|nr:enoyl-CoA hydratase/isomerase family protein [Myxococcales bacterium]
MSDHKDFRVEFDAATGVATLWMQMAGRANKINGAFGVGFVAALDDALAQAGLKGLVIASGHRDFCVGADLEFIYQTRDAEALYALVDGLHTTLRKLETAGVPVVAAITGSALGGGCELALACHHRIALDSPAVQIGLPEVSLGVIPGGGGTQRLPRLIGIQPALEILAQGQILRVPQALKKGLVDELARDADDLKAKAVAWIAANRRAQQPWDKKGFQWPGGVQPDTPEARNLFAGGAAMLVQKTAGAYKAPEAAVQAAYEGSLLTFEAALRVEARYFVDRVVSDQAKDMIRTFFFHKQAVDRQQGLPQVASDGFQKVAVLGAGMMGAGLAVICAQRGYDVVLKDITDEALTKARAHVQAEVGKKRHLSADDKQAIAARVTYTTDYADVAGSDLVIEAVFENLALKHRVIKECEAVLGEDAIFASNTSALPITALAEASVRPANFIGLHYFSPVEKMPLVEVITAEATSERTLARCLAFARKTKKTAVVVNDGYGFFTTRVFSAYILEAAELVAEGHDPVLVEWAARQEGMVVPPLKVFDEVTLTLGKKALESREAYTGEALDSPGLRLLKALVEQGRHGKAAGAGFYDYSAKPRRIWAGLRDLVPEPPEDSTVDYIAERLMLAQALEAARTLDEGVLKSPRDGEIGAIFGVGFAPNTGGPFAWLDRQGAANVVARCAQLVADGHARFAPPGNLKAMAEAGATFFD